MSANGRKHSVQLSPNLLSFGSLLVSTVFVKFRESDFERFVQSAQDRFQRNLRFTQAHTIKRMKITCNARKKTIMLWLHYILRVTYSSSQRIDNINRHGVIPIFILTPSFRPTFGGNKKGFIMGSWVKRWKCMEQNKFNRLQMVQFECPRITNPCVSFHFQPLVFLPSYLWGDKKWFIMGCWGKRWKLF